MPYSQGRSIVFEPAELFRTNMIQRGELDIFLMQHNLGLDH